MSQIMTGLENLKTALGEISGIESLKIGLEDNITPADYPMIRIVPSMIDNTRATLRKRRIEVLIYFGAAIPPFDDVADDDGRVALEKVYAAMLDIEQQIIDLLNTLNGGLYLGTITDEDRLETYKLMAVRGQILA